MATARKPRPNPFYVLLMLVSTLFVITALGYLVGPYVERQAAEGRAPAPASRALAGWFERKGVVALAIEFAAMTVFAILAMATDRYFAPSKATTGPRPTSV